MAIPGPKPNKLLLPAIYKVVAQRLHFPTETVQAVVEAFLDVVRIGVLQQNQVVLRTFGSFHIKRVKQGIRIAYKPAVEFKSDAKKVLPPKEPPMEKYGVAETKNDAVLMAQVTNQCPDCKAELTSKSPPHCPNCGTKPFEEKPK